MSEYDKQLQFRALLESYQHECHKANKECAAIINKAHREISDAMTDCDRSKFDAKQEFTSSIIASGLQAQYQEWIELQREMKVKTDNE